MIRILLVGAAALALGTGGAFAQSTYSEQSTTNSVQSPSGAPMSGDSTYEAKSKSQNSDGSETVESKTYRKDSSGGVSVNKSTRNYDENGSETSRTDQSKSVTPEGQTTESNSTSTTTPGP
jgi:hypothetical protein